MLTGSSTGIHTSHHECPCSCPFPTGYLLVQDGLAPQIQRAADVGRQAWAPSTAGGVSDLQKVISLQWLRHDTKFSCVDVKMFTWSRPVCDDVVISCA